LSDELSCVIMFSLCVQVGNKTMLALNLELLLLADYNFS